MQHRTDALRRLRPVFIGSTALLILLLAVFAYALASSQNHQRQDIRKRFKDRAEVAAAVNESIFTLSTSSIKGQDGAQFGGKTVNQAALVARVKQSQQPYGLILAQDGTVLAASPGAPKRKPGRAALVKKAIKTNRTEYSGLTPGPGGRSVVESATSFPTPNGVRVDVSAVDGDLLAAFINSFLSKLPNVSNARSYLIDEMAKVIATPGAKSKAGTSLPNADLARSVLKKDQGSFGGNQYFTSAPIKSTPWRIVLTAAESDLYSSVKTTVPWIIFASFVLVSALGLFLLRRVLRANAELERADLSRRHALEINDNVVQRLVLAKYALDRGSTETSQQKLAETLRETQQLVSSLLEEKEIGPGSLRRTAAAEAEGPPEPRTPAGRMGETEQ